MSGEDNGAGVTPEPIPTWGDNWRAAEAKLVAEGKGGSEEPEPEVPVIPEETPTEPTAAPVEEPDGEKPDAAARQAKVDALNKLATELGLKVDTRGVSVEERVGLRAEKREWHTKAKARDAEYAEKLQRTQAYFAPLGDAVEALKSGDYDATIKALAKVVGDEDVASEGLNGATKRYLKRAAGEDPRVDALERELKQRREHEAKQEQAREQAEAQQMAAKQRENFTQATAAELAKGADPVIQRAAKNPAFAAQVVAVMEENWDGTETLSREDAAAEVVTRLRSAYKELQEMFGDLDPSNPENPDASQGASRSGKEAVGKQKPKPHSGRHATEASPPGRATTAEEWRQKWGRALAAADD